MKKRKPRFGSPKRKEENSAPICSGEEYAVCLVWLIFLKIIFSTKGNISKLVDIIRI